MLFWGRDGSGPRNSGGWGVGERGGFRLLGGCFENCCVIKIVCIYFRRLKRQTILIVSTEKMLGFRDIKHFSI